MTNKCPSHGSGSQVSDGAPVIWGGEDGQWETSHEVRIGSKEGTRDWGGLQESAHPQLWSCPPRSAYAGNLLVRVDFLVPRQSSHPGGLKHFHVFSVPATAKSAKREDLLVGSACVRLLWKDSKDWFCFGGFPKHPIPILQGWAHEN